MSLHFVRVAGRPLWEWLRDRPVVASPGYTFQVFDITQDPEAQAVLARLYADHGWNEAARREAQRALRIDPEQALARGVLNRMGGS